MNIYFDHIYLDTTIPKETLDKLSENNNRTPDTIQKGYTEYLATFIRSFLYNTLFTQRTKTRVSFQIKSQFKSFDNLKQAVIAITPLTLNSISLYYPKTNKAKGVNVNPLPSPRLKYVLDTFILTLEKIMFTKYLQEYLNTLK